MKPLLADLPALTADELDELGLAVTSRMSMYHDVLTKMGDTPTRTDVTKRYHICQSLSTAIAEARLNVR